MHALPLGGRSALLGLQLATQALLQGIAGSSKGTMFGAGVHAALDPTHQMPILAHLHGAAEAGDLDEVDGYVRIGLVLQHSVKGAEGDGHARRQAHPGRQRALRACMQCNSPVRLGRASATGVSCRICYSA